VTSGGRPGLPDAPSAAEAPGAAKARPRLRAAQKEMTRRLLLANALELFEARGYAATTIDDIAHAAGTTRVTFYAHFPARIDLIRALFDELNEYLERRDSGGPASEVKLVMAVQAGTREALTAWIQHSAARWPKVQPYLHTADQAAITDPEIRALVDAWWDGAYGDIVAGLDAAGRFEPSTRRIRAEFAFVQLHHMATSWLRRGWDVDSETELSVLAGSWYSLLGQP
jgi:AcrR family transcriptional regulator